MTLDVRSLAYAPGVSVLPARSGFTPGWVYVHVCGGAACLTSLIYWALVLLEFVVCSTALVDLTVRTLYHCIRNVICYIMYHYLLKKLWCIIVKFSPVLWLRTVLLIWCVFILLMVLGYTLWYSGTHCCCSRVLFLAHLLLLPCTVSGTPCCCCRVLFLAHLLLPCTVSGTQCCCRVLFLAHLLLPCTVSGTQLLPCTVSGTPVVVAVYCFWHTLLLLPCTVSGTQCCCRVLFLAHLLLLPCTVSGTLVVAVYCFWHTLLLLPCTVSGTQCCCRVLFLGHPVVVAVYCFWHTLLLLPCTVSGTLVVVAVYCFWHTLLLPCTVSGTPCCCPVLFLAHPVVAVYCFWHTLLLPCTVSHCV